MQMKPILELGNGIGQALNHYLSPQFGVRFPELIELETLGLT